MILKRVLPVIAAIAVLCCMMIVPASAASFSDSVSLGYVPCMNLEACLYLDNSDGSSILSVPVSNRFFGSDETWESDGAFLGGSTSYYLTTDFDYDFPFVTHQLSVHPSNNLTKVNFSGGDFVVPFDQLKNVFKLGSSCFCRLSVSFKAVVVNENHKPTVVPISYDSSVASAYFNPFDISAVTSALSALGVSSDSYVMVCDFNMEVVYGEPVTECYFSVGCLPYGSSLVASDFLFDGRIDFGDVVGGDVDGADILQGFSSFLTDGVGAFLATPTFGEFSIGDLLAGVVAVLFALVIIKMFAH